MIDTAALLFSCLVTQPPRGTLDTGCARCSVRTMPASTPNGTDGHTTAEPDAHTDSPQPGFSTVLAKCFREERGEEGGRGGRTTSCPARIESRQTEHWMRVPSGAQALDCRRSVCSSTVAAAWVVVRAAVVAWRVWARACTAPRSIAAHSPQSSCPPFLRAQASIGAND